MKGSVDCYVRVFAEVEDPIVSESLKIDFNDREWTEKQNDGYYYYRKVLRSGEVTEPLFTQIICGKGYRQLQDDMLQRNGTVGRQI